MELPLGCSYGQGRYTYEADASTAYEPEAAAGAGDLRPRRNRGRIEMVKNAGQVALEAGNSVAIVMKHYFNIVEARAAREYWNIWPAKKRSNIAPMIAC